MRTWGRVPRDLVCGHDHTHHLHRGDPLLTITGPGWVKLRCRLCAGEPVPKDLPPLVDPQVALKPMVPIRTGLDALPFDFKTRAAGRDPGDDD